MYVDLARGAGDRAEGWLWALGAIVLYAVISYGLEYRSRARRGSRHPARDALHDLKDREDPQPARQRFVSRVIMLGGAAATVLVAFVAAGAVRIVAVGLTGVVAVGVWAYYDHRSESAGTAGTE